MARYNTALFQARKFRITNPTEGEAALIAALTANGLSFQRERPLLGRYFADFFFGPEKLIIEVDGPHHQEPRRKAADARRSADLRARGFEIIRFGNAEVLTEPDRVVARIVETLRARGVQSRPASV